MVMVMVMVCNGSEGEGEGERGMDGGEWVGRIRGRECVHHKELYLSCHVIETDSRHDAQRR